MSSGGVWRLLARVRLDVRVVQLGPAAVGGHLVEDAVDEGDEVLLALLDADPERLLGERLATDLETLVLPREAEEDGVVGRDGVAAPVEQGLGGLRVRCEQDEVGLLDAPVAQVRLRRGALARAHLDAGGHEVVDGLVRAVALDEDLLAGQVVDLAEVDLPETLLVARHRADDDVHPVLLEERDPVGADRLDELRLDAEGAGDLAAQVGIEPLDVTGCRVAEAERDHVELDATHELARRADRVERGSFGAEARRRARRGTASRARRWTARGAACRLAAGLPAALGELAAPVAPPPLLHAARSRPPATRRAASRRIVSPSADPGRGPVASAGGWFRGSASSVPARGRRSTARACRSPRPHRDP